LKLPSCTSVAALALVAFAVAPATLAAKHAPARRAIATKTARKHVPAHRTVARHVHTRVQAPPVQAYTLQNWPESLVPPPSAALEVPPPPPAVSNCQSCTSPLIARAYSLIGTRYQLGGTTPETGFDCSGFTRYIYETAAGYRLPPSAPLQYNFARGLPVDKGELAPGDLVFFRTPRGWHVGMYVGENSFIHAPNHRRTVSVSSLGEVYWQRAYRGARRIPLAESAPATGEVASNN
jgi:cell wall-associated NlpC family hydrolase